MIKKLALALTLLLAGCSTTSWFSKDVVPTDMPAAIAVHRPVALCLDGLVVSVS